ncbi:helix-turn-helix transcriptional regulator [Jannaschia pohangensis]|uniref:HTH domain-containing protein n=1 Tax=Jannaschia pohangensis TaxID=390807 RepID=A0A1I3HL94_9RHOB|nr:YafY family protein [Jannaschia pohangensis]SFI36422.1 HTH domain-containing protein [Jannaschia pohangensis]
MRRADRLFRLVQTLRDGKLWTAARLAEAMEVSERTVYRDIADLMASGVPIEGAAGVGYLMRDGYDLPPLMFSEAESTALALGARLVAAWGGERMAQNAREALTKIEAVLPRPHVVQEALDRLGAIPQDLATEARGRIDVLDAAIRDAVMVTLVYQDAGGTPSTRLVEPLGQWFWGQTWTLVAWCRLREDFRMFRLDRIVSLEVSEDSTGKRPDRSLRTCIAQMEAREGRSFPRDSIR